MDKEVTKTIDDMRKKYGCLYLGWVNMVNVNFIDCQLVVNKNKSGMKKREPITRNQPIYYAIQCDIGDYIVKYKLRNKQLYSTGKKLINVYKVTDVTSNLYPIGNSIDITDEDYNIIKDTIEKFHEIQQQK